jgi:hypothetical protein
MKLFRTNYFTVNTKKGGALIVAGRLRLGCRLALRPERLGDCLKRNGPQIADVISDSGFEFRQNGVQFALSLGGDGPISEETDAVFEAGRHGDRLKVSHQVGKRDTAFTV